MTLEELGQVLLLGSALLLVAVSAVRLTQSAGLPSLLAYLLLGVALGGPGLGLDVEVDVAQSLAVAALVVVLAEGGLTTSWRRARPVLPLAATLATVGVVVSTCVTALGAALLLDLDAGTALLLGAVVSSTDAAAVFSVLRGLPLKRRLVGVLEAESGSNDPLAVVVVLALSESVTGSASVGALAARAVFELVVGLGVGLLAGRLGVAYLRRSALPSSGLYPITVLGFAVLAFGVASAVHASGFLAVYVAALVLGNGDLPHRQQTLGFTEGLGWLAQIGLFVLLGLLIEPSRLPEAVLPALGVGAVLLLVARPLSVVVAATPFRVPWREQALLSWGGLRGAVPIVFATIPLTEGVPGAERLFDVVVVLVVVFTLIQGPTLAPVARRLGVVEADGPTDLVVEAAPLEGMRAEMFTVPVAPGSRLRGVEVQELRLPRGASVAFVVREGDTLVPTLTTTLRPGDQLFVVTRREDRADAERRLRAIAEEGRLARWLPPGRPR